MTKPNRFNFFASKAKKEKHAQQTSLESVNQIEPQVGHAEKSTQQQPHTAVQKHSSSSSHSSERSQLHLDPDSFSRIPRGTRVIELRDPVPLASLKVKSSRQRGVKTESYRLRVGGSRAVNDAGEVSQADNSCVIPLGTRAVALEEPVRLADFIEVSIKGRKQRRGTEKVIGRNETETMRVVVGS